VRSLLISATVEVSDFTLGKELGFGQCIAKTTFKTTIGRDFG